MGYYTTMAGAQELVMGMSAQYNLQDEGDQQVIFGVFDRFGDAIIPMIGFVYKNIRLTFTYDITTSALKNYDNGLWRLGICAGQPGFSTASIMGIKDSRSVRPSNSSPSITTNETDALFLRKNKTWMIWRHRWSMH